ncbi:MAG: fibronectin type III domain-containing protein, partial [Verrucomicrobiota bacterium]
MTPPWGDGTSRIIGSGTVSNSGVLSGDGFIATTFTNNSGGELRAEAGKTLTFTGATGANAGRVNLQGGTLEFGQAFTNSATGVIQGRGAVNFNGGLVNQGSMNFSAGTTDIDGNISMTGGTGGSARLISSGGGTVTVNSNFDHHGAEVRTSAGCNTVFFGTVTGPGPYTGTGTVYYEGTFSPGASPASVTFAGSLVCGGNLVTIMELGGTTRGTQYDSIQVADNITLAGTLSVKLINGFLPAAGNSFDLFDWGSHTGTFSTLDLPALTSGLSWDTSDLYTTGSLDVLADIPPTPGNLTATPQPGLILRLQWQNTSPPASGFEVQRALDAGFTDALHSVILPAGQTTYDDADRTPETTYHYRVRALGSPTPSAFSTPAEALTPTRLADWRWVHFGDQNPVGDGEDFNDFDHDGVVNLQEYACNMDPRVPDAKTLTTGGTSGLPAVKRASNGHL